MKFPALIGPFGDAWAETGQYSFSYYIGRLQRICVFDTNKSWLSLDQIFYFSAIPDFPLALLLSEKRCSNTWDALLCIICFLTFFMTCDL